MKTWKRTIVAGLLVAISLTTFAEIPKYKKFGSIEGLEQFVGFYTKETYWSGIEIATSSTVPEETLYAARDVMELMLGKQDKPHLLRSDIVQGIKRHGGYVVVMGEGQVTSDIPEHSDLDESYNATRGLGGVIGEPITLAAEENLMQYGTSRDVFQGENIFMHEFAHTIFNLGFEDSFRAEVENCFNRAVDLSLWDNTYAIENVFEYFAEGVQSYFNQNLESIPSNGIHNEVNTQGELKDYDLCLFNMVDLALNPKHRRDLLDPVAGESIRIRQYAIGKIELVKPTRGRGLSENISLEIFDENTGSVSITSYSDDIDFINSELSQLEFGSSFKVRSRISDSSTDVRRLMPPRYSFQKAFGDFDNAVQFSAPASGGWALTMSIL